MSQIAKKLTSTFLHTLNKMTSLEKVIANNQLAEDLIVSLQRDFTNLKNDKTIQKIAELKKENDELKKQVDLVKSQLVNLETKHGKEQIPMPSFEASKEPMVDQLQAPVVAKPEQKPNKEKKPKAEKPAAKEPNPMVTEEPPVDIGRIDLRVGKIVEVGLHPDADSLYLEQIDLNESKPRTVISGLVKHIKLEDMKDRMVVVMCNLKPAKMRGILSEGMVMCASSPEKVEILSPPAGAVPGDLVHCEGYNRNPDAQLNPKKKIFETVAPDLMTNGELAACYKGALLIVPGKGQILAQTLKNVNVK
jgi:aminoacyl tRNA synthase complex-interacting multifunctional protein 1